MTRPRYFKRTPRARAILLSPIIAASAMALSSLSVVANSNRLRTYGRPDLRPVEETGIRN